MRKRQDGGFSLIELTVAMVVTLIVTGAVYGLLTGGQNAFRREPELSDRQQNIRSAMDLIMRDIASAGAGMPGFIQSFTPNLDGLGPFVGPSNQKTDELEMIANTGDFAPEPACGYPGGVSADLFMMGGATHVTTGMVPMIVMTDGTWTMKQAVSVNPPPNTSQGDCLANTNHAHPGFNSGSADKTGYNMPGGLCAGNPITDGSGACIGCTGQGGSYMPGTSCCNTTGCKVAYVTSGAIVRYRIRTGTDGVPNLERFSSDLSTNFSGGTPQFQTIARGIDDLQITYTAASGAPPTASAPYVDQTQLNYGTLIQSVTVTLSARSEVQNVVGVSRPAAGPNALRGTLTSVGSPRATLNVLGTPLASRKTGWTGPSPWN